MTFIPEEFPCPLCECPTHGHAVPDESSTLCRDCFLTWIARGEGAELEERIVSIECVNTLDEAKPLADRMRELHKNHRAQARGQ